MVVLVPITANSATVQDTEPSSVNSPTVPTAAKSTTVKSTAPSTPNSSTDESIADTTIDFPSQEFGGGFLGQTSMHFTTNRTLDLKAPIQKLLLNAQAYSLNLTLHGSCNNNIKWRVGKCEAAFFREESHVQNFSILFTTETIHYLLQTTKKECFGNFFADGTVHFVVVANAFTECTFLFTLSGEETNSTGWTRIGTADPRFFFYSPTIHKSNSKFYFYCFISGAALIAFLGAMALGRIMNSDGLGDDVASDIVMCPGAPCSERDGSSSGVEMEEVVDVKSSGGSIERSDDL